MSFCYWDSYSYSKGITITRLLILEKMFLNLLETHYIFIGKMSLNHGKRKILFIMTYLAHGIR